MTQNTAVADHAASTCMTNGRGVPERVAWAAAQACAALEDYAAQQDAQDTHKYVAELWPPNATQRTLPEHLVVWARNLREAQEMAQEQAPAGWYANVASHVRGMCRPAHPGR